MHDPIKAAKGTIKIFQLNQVRLKWVKASSIPIKKIKSNNKYQLLNAICELNWVAIAPNKTPTPNAKKAFAIFFKAFTKS